MFQVESADTPSAPPPVAPGEDPGCTDTTVTVTDTTSLADLAKQVLCSIWPWAVAFKQINFVVPRQATLASSARCL
jgi:hypothetical protein